MGREHCYLLGSLGVALGTDLLGSLGGHSRHRSARILGGFALGIDLLESLGGHSRHRSARILGRSL